MKILIATHNQSKLERYKRILKESPNLKLVSLSDLGITEKVEENHDTNVENALYKARTYGDLSGLITIAIDEALMTNFLPDNEQPGVFARRFSKNKKELTDNELIEVWKKIFEMYPQKDKKFIWNFAVAFYNPKNKSEGVECVEEISYVAKHFSELPTNGYPMSTFLSFEEDGKPYIEVSQKEKHIKDKKNFKVFVKNFNKWMEFQKYPLCVHCQENLGTTSDHVFPKSWYCDDTPADVQRPTVPTCKNCNNNLGQIEENLGRKIVLCVDPKKAEANGIHKKVFRSLGLHVNSKLIKPKELQKRLMLRKKILNSITPYKKGDPCFPGFGPKENYPKENLKAIDIKEKEVLTVSRKIIVGLEYFFDKRYIKKPLKVDVHFPKETANVADIERILNLGAITTYGPGFKVERSKTNEDLYSVIYRITIWGSWLIYGTIIKSKDND